MDGRRSQAAKGSNAPKTAEEQKKMQDEYNANMARFRQASSNMQQPPVQNANNQQALFQNANLIQSRKDVQAQADISSQSKKRHFNLNIPPQALSVANNSGLGRLMTGVTQALKPLERSKLEPYFNQLYSSNYHAGDPMQTFRSDRPVSNIFMSDRQLNIRDFSFLGRSLADAYKIIIGKINAHAPPADVQNLYAPLMQLVNEMEDFSNYLGASDNVIVQKGESKPSVFEAQFVLGNLFQNIDYSTTQYLAEYKRNRILAPYTEGEKYKDAEVEQAVIASRQIADSYRPLSLKNLNLTPYEIYHGYSNGSDLPFSVKAPLEKYRDILSKINQIPIDGKNVLQERGDVFQQINNRDMNLLGNEYFVRAKKAIQNRVFPNGTSVVSPAMFLLQNGNMFKDLDNTQIKDEQKVSKYIIGGAKVSMMPNLQKILDKMGDDLNQKFQRQYMTISGFGQSKSTNLQKFIEEYVDFEDAATDIESNMRMMMPAFKVLGIPNIKGVITSQLPDGFFGNAMYSRLVKQVVDDANSGKMTQLQIDNSISSIKDYYKKIKHQYDNLMKDNQQIADMDFDKGVKADLTLQDMHTEADYKQLPKLTILKASGYLDLPGHIYALNLLGSNQGYQQDMTEFEESRKQANYFNKVGIIAQQFRRFIAGNFKKNENEFNEIYGKTDPSQKQYIFDVRNKVLPALLANKEKDIQLQTLQKLREKIDENKQSTKYLEAQEQLAKDAKDMRSDIGMNLDDPEDDQINTAIQFMNLPDYAPSQYYLDPGVAKQLKSVRDEIASDEVYYNELEQAIKEGRTNDFYKKYNQDQYLALFRSLKGLHQDPGQMNMMTRFQVAYMVDSFFDGNDIDSVQQELENSADFQMNVQGVDQQGNFKINNEYMNSYRTAFATRFIGQRPLQGYTQNLYALPIGALSVLSHLGVIQQRNGGFFHKFSDDYTDNAFVPTDVKNKKTRKIFASILEDFANDVHSHGKMTKDQVRYWQETIKMLNMSGRELKDYSAKASMQSLGNNLGVYDPQTYVQYNDQALLLDQNIQEPMINGRIIFNPLDIPIEAFLPPGQQYTNTQLESFGTQYTIKALKNMQSSAVNNVNAQALSNPDISIQLDVNKDILGQLDKYKEGAAKLSSQIQEDFDLIQKIHLMQMEFDKKKGFKLGQQNEQDQQMNDDQNNLVYQPPQQIFSVQKTKRQKKNQEEEKKGDQQQQPDNNMSINQNVNPVGNQQQGADEMIDQSQVPKGNNPEENKGDDIFFDADGEVEVVEEGDPEIDYVADVLEYPMQYRPLTQKLSDNESVETFIERWIRQRTTQSMSGVPLYSQAPLIDSLQNLNFPFQRINDVIAFSKSVLTSEDIARVAFREVPNLQNLEVKFDVEQQGHIQNYINQIHKPENQLLNTNDRFKTPLVELKFTISDGKDPNNLKRFALAYDHPAGAMLTGSFRDEFDKSQIQRNLKRNPQYLDTDIADGGLLPDNKNASYVVNANIRTPGYVPPSADQDQPSNIPNQQQPESDQRFKNEIKLFDKPPETYFNKSLERIFKIRNPYTQTLADLNPIDRAIYDIAQDTKDMPKNPADEERGVTDKIDSFFKYLDSARRTINNKGITKAYPVVAQVLNLMKTRLPHNRIGYLAADTEQRLRENDQKIMTLHGVGLNNFMSQIANKYQQEQFKLDNNMFADLSYRDLIEKRKQLVLQYASDSFNNIDDLEKLIQQFNSDSLTPEMRNDLLKKLAKHAVVEDNKNPTLGKRPRDFGNVKKEMHNLSDQLAQANVLFVENDPNNREYQQFLDLAQRSKDRYESIQSSLRQSKNYTRKLKDMQFNITKLQDAMQDKQRQVEELKVKSQVQDRQIATTISQAQYNLNATVNRTQQQFQQFTREAQKITHNYLNYYATRSDYLDMIDQIEKLKAIMKHDDFNLNVNALSEAKRQEELTKKLFQTSKASSQVIEMYSKLATTFDQHMVTRQNEFIEASALNHKLQQNLQHTQQELESFKSAQSIEIKRVSAELQHKAQLEQQQYEQKKNSIIAETQKLEIEFSNKKIQLQQLSQQIGVAGDIGQMQGERQQLAIQHQQLYTDIQNLQHRKDTLSQELVLAGQKLQNEKLAADQHMTQIKNQHDQQAHKLKMDIQNEEMKYNQNKLSIYAKARQYTDFLKAANIGEIITDTSNYAADPLVKKFQQFLKKSLSAYGKMGDDFLAGLSQADKQNFEQSTTYLNFKNNISEKTIDGLIQASKSLSDERDKLRAEISEQKRQFQIKDAEYKRLTAQVESTKLTVAAQQETLSKHLLEMTATKLQDNATIQKKINELGMAGTNIVAQFNSANIDHQRLTAQIQALQDDERGYQTEIQRLKIETEANGREYQKLLGLQKELEKTQYVATQQELQLRAIEQANAIANNSIAGIRQPAQAPAQPAGGNNQMQQAPPAGGQLQRVQQQPVQGANWAPPFNIQLYQNQPRGQAPIVRNIQPNLNINAGLMRPVTQNIQDILNAQQRYRAPSQYTVAGDIDTKRTQLGGFDWLELVSQNALIQQMRRDVNVNLNHQDMAPIINIYNVAAEQSQKMADQIIKSTGAIASHYSAFQSNVYQDIMQVEGHEKIMQNILNEVNESSSILLGAQKGFQGIRQILDNVQEATTNFTRFKVTHGQDTQKLLQMRGMFDDVVAGISNLAASSLDPNMDVTKAIRVESKARDVTNQLQQLQTVLSQQFVQKDTGNAANLAFRESMQRVDNLVNMFADNQFEQILNQQAAGQNAAQLNAAFPGKQNIVNFMTDRLNTGIIAQIRQIYAGPNRNQIDLVRQASIAAGAESGMAALQKIVNIMGSNIYVAQMQAMQGGLTQANLQDIANLANAANQPANQNNAANQLLNVISQDLQNQGNRIHADSQRFRNQFVTDLATQQSQTKQTLIQNLTNQDVYRVIQDSNQKNQQMLNNLFTKLTLNDQAAGQNQLVQNFQQVFNSQATQDQIKQKEYQDQIQGAIQNSLQNFNQAPAPNAGNINANFANIPARTSIMNQSAANLQSLTDQTRVPLQSSRLFAGTLLGGRVNSEAQNVVEGKFGGLQRQQLQKKIQSQSKDENDRIRDAAQNALQDMQQTQATIQTTMNNRVQNQYNQDDRDGFLDFINVNALNNFAREVEDNLQRLGNNDNLRQFQVIYSNILGQLETAKNAKQPGQRFVDLADIEVALTASIQQHGANRRTFFGTNFDIQGCLSRIAKEMCVGSIASLQAQFQKMYADSFSENSNFSQDLFDKTSSYMGVLDTLQRQIPNIIVDRNQVQSLNTVLENLKVQMNEYMERGLETVDVQQQLMVNNLTEVINEIAKNEPNHRIADKMNEESEKSMAFLQNQFMRALQQFGLNAADLGNADAGKGKQVMRAAAEQVAPPRYAYDPQARRMLPYQESSQYAKERGFSRQGEEEKQRRLFSGQRQQEEKKVERDNEGKPSAKSLLSDKEYHKALGLSKMTKDEVEFLKRVEYKNKKLMIDGRELTQEEKTKFAKAIVKLIVVIYSDIHPKQAKDIMQKQQTLVKEATQEQHIPKFVSLMHKLLKKNISQED